MAVPRSNCTTTETTNGKQNGHHRTTANHIISEDQPDISSNDVVGEIETLSLTHPIVRLDFYKATDGFQDREHEEEIKPSSKFIIDVFCVHMLFLLINDFLCHDYYNFTPLVIIIALTLPPPLSLSL